MADFVNHTSLPQKLDLRNAKYEFFGAKKVDLVVDYYAGEGDIASLFWQHSCERLICVEKNPSKKAALESALPNAEIHIADNKSLAELSAESQIVDCDACGNPFPFIRLVLAVSRCPKKLIFFTHGGSKLKNTETMAKELNPDRIHVEDAQGSSGMRYGWAFFG